MTLYLISILNPGNCEDVYSYQSPSYTTSLLPESNCVCSKSNVLNLRTEAVL